MRDYLFLSIFALEPTFCGYFHVLDKKRRYVEIYCLFLAIIGFTQAGAQTNCDSLDIQVAYSPFYDSLIEVRVWNNGSTFFNYPGFIIYNSNGDTVAKETLNLFGIAQSSIHVLNVYPGAISSSSFNGTLELYTNAYNDLTCTYARNFDLCPDSCENAIVSLGNTGGAIFTGTVNYEIKNSAAQLVKSGTLTIGTSQHDADTACLFPGDYTLHLSQIALSGDGQKNYTITRDSATYPTPSWFYHQTTDTSFAFSFFKKCTIPTTVQSVEANTATSITAGGGQLKLFNPSGQVIEDFLLYAMDGKIIAREYIIKAAHSVDIAHLAPGIYIAQIRQHGKVHFQKIFIAD